MNGDSDSVSVGTSRLHSATCRDCGKRISDRTERCPACGVRRRAPPESSLFDPVGSNAPLAAGLLSAAFPGLGHLYLRDLERGTGLALAGVLVVAALFVAGVPPVFAMPVALVLWAAAAYDAYARAGRTAAHETAAGE
ncbi:hypothetical protein [Halomicrobium salinisoli]|uniref:hypothetical protein n=1 Tax=Halomicrobium salinisoli TaxID=2878391 RepID=UPI001CF03863|nr:hypothetical protein [Halomicrobium salinisoli]